MTVGSIIIDTLSIHKSDKLFKVCINNTRVITVISTKRQNKSTKQ